MGLGADFSPFQGSGPSPLLEDAAEFCQGENHTFANVSFQSRFPRVKMHANNVLAAGALPRTPLVSSPQTRWLVLGERREGRKEWKALPHRNVTPTVVGLFARAISLF